MRPRPSHSVVKQEDPIGQPEILETRYGFLEVGFERGGERLTTKSRILPVRARRSEGRLLLDSLPREGDFLGQELLPVIKVVYIYRYLIKTSPTFGLSLFSLLDCIKK